MKSFLGTWICYNCVLIISVDYNLKITNIGSIPIDLLEISVESTIEQSLKNSIIQVDIDNIKDYLPIAPKSEIILGIHLIGALNFLSSNQYQLTGTQFLNCILY